MIDAFEPKLVDEDEIVIKQGDPGDYFYVIDCGECVREHAAPCSSSDATVAVG